MRQLFQTSKFKKDLKREMKGRHRTSLEKELSDLIDLLRGDATLPARYSDHQLGGGLKDCRDAHVLPDLVLIYRKIGSTKLQLVRLGSHSELSL